MSPRQRPTARVLRPRDLLDLRITAVDATIRRGPGGPTLSVGRGGGHLVVEFAFQHLGEESYPESAVSPEPFGVASHRAARPSRLVYDLPAGTEIDWTAEGLLAALPTLRLRVAPLATAALKREADASRIPQWLRRRVIPDRAPTATEIRMVRGLTRGTVGRVDSLRGTVPPFPVTPIRPIRAVPRAPQPDETALEVPYRLIVSPSAPHGAFRHSIKPLGAGEDDSRVQLWRTELTTRLEDEAQRFLGHTEETTQRIVRAVWARDMEPPDRGHDDDVVPMSTDPVARRSIVRQSAAVHEGVTPIPIGVQRLYLSALGAWVDWRGAWDTMPYTSLDPWKFGNVKLFTAYRHVADMGRDSYVRLNQPGFLFPFGHRAELVTITERKVHDPTRTAYLRTRRFIVLKQTVLDWADRDTPLAQVTLDPTVTPDLDQPAPSGGHFFPQRGGLPFAWDLLAVDRAGEPVTLSAPLLFVFDDFIADERRAGKTPAQIGKAISDAYDTHRTVPGRGQSISFAASAAHGDTRLETNSLTFDGVTDTQAFTSRPYLLQANAVVPALRHVAGLAPGVDLGFAPSYLAPDPDPDHKDADGFGPANPGGLFLLLKGAPVSIDYSTGTDKAGGFVSPSQVVRALSRSLGAVGDDGVAANGLAAGKFDPTAFLQGAFPKLFGLFDLIELLKAATGEQGLDAAPAVITEALDAVSAILAEVKRLSKAVTSAKDRLDADLLAAVKQGAHQGARDAIATAKAQVDNAAAPLLGRLDAVATALGSLAGNAGGVAAAQAAVTDLAGSLGDLRTALDHPRIPVAVRSAISAPLEALVALLDAADLLQSVADFAENLLTPADGVTSRFEWRPAIGSWKSAANPVFRVNDEQGFSLAVVVRASAQGAPSADISAEQRDFALRLLPDEPLLGANFSRVGFRVGSGGKPEVDVVFDGIEFLGALGFIETLRRMIPFDAFADPPYVDASADGVTAGFDLELPNVAVGAFSLENIALAADARVPFLGDAVTIGFAFCSKDSPFRLTVMCIGGGGWVAVRLSPMGMVELEMGLEAAAALSVDLGVASGSVSVSVGVYLRLEGDAGSLTGYFRIRGEVDVIGLISASITLELALSYDFPTGKMIGRASIVVEVEVLFFSASVEISCERKLAGSKGDPVMAEIMPPDQSGHNADWSRYCAAFAPGA